MSTDGKLKSFVERLHNMHDQKDEVMQDLKEIFAEAKAEGYDTKALRAVIRKQRKNQQELRELEQTMELYEAAL